MKMLIYLWTVSKQTTDMPCQLKWMEDLEEILKTVEIYFSVYFDLLLDIQIMSNKYLIDFLGF